MQLVESRMVWGLDFGVFCDEAFEVFSVVLYSDKGDETAHMRVTDLEGIEEAIMAITKEVRH